LINRSKTGNIISVYKPNTGKSFSKRLRIDEAIDEFKEDTPMVFEKVRDILVEQLDVDEDAVTMESAIADDLGADSLDVVDLVMSLEEEFDTEIPDEEIENLKTVGDVVHYIEDNLM